MIRYWRLINSMQMHSVFMNEIERLKRLLIGMGISHNDREDILQDVYLEAMQKPPKHGNTQENTNWLMKVTTNKCMLKFRQKKQCQKVEDAVNKTFYEQKKTQEPPDILVSSNEENNAIKHCLSKMEESLKVPLVMKYFCGLNSSQISEILELKPGTVRKRLYHARVILAEMLIEKGIEK